MRDAPSTVEAVPAVAPGAGSATRPPGIALGAMLFLVTFAVFWPVRGHGFVALDDPDYFADNRMVQAGLTWAGVKWAFVTGHASNWHPLTWLTHMLDVELFGAGPAAPHVVNALIHAANAALLFGVLRLLTGASWRSAIVAALFALHPLRVESVAWISERKDVLSTLFFLLTVWAYGRAARGVASESGEGRGEGTLRAGDIHRQRGEESTVSPVDEPGTGGALPSPLATFTCPSAHRAAPLDTCPRPSARSAVRWYIATLLFFALGLMSKPMLVTLPFVLLLLDWWPLGRFTGLDACGAGVNKPAAAAGAWLIAARRLWSLVVEKLPFFALSAASCVITYVVQQRGGAVRSLATFSLMERAENAVVGYARYVGKTLWPAELSVFYPHPHHWSWIVLLLSAVVVFGTTVAVAVLSRRLPFAFTGWFWFVGMMVPTVGFVQVGEHSIADRYTYLPSIGLLIAIVWAAGEAAHRWRLGRFVIGCVAAAAIAGATAATCTHLPVWCSSEALFRHALQLDPRNYVAHNSLGFTFLQQGRLEQAAAEFEATLAIRPGFADAHNNLGTVWLQRGDGGKAELHFRKAIESLPTFALAHYNLGTLMLERGDANGAAVELTRAIAYRADDQLTHLNLGNALLQLGRVDEAIASYRRAIGLDPASADAHGNLGNALLQVGRTEDAEHELEDAVRLQPYHANAHFLLGEALARRGRLDPAIEHFERAVAINGTDVDALQRLAFALMERGRSREARPHLETLVRLQPSNPEPLATLAWLLAASCDGALRDGARAVDLARRADDLASRRSPGALCSLAAAYAETGRFAEAVDAAQRALQLAREESTLPLVADISRQLESYRSGAPYRDPRLP